MSAISRVGADQHIGHARARPAAPYHQTHYATGSPDVYVNGSKAVRKGDKAGCGDVAQGCSSTVFVNGIGVHRQGDATAGHDGWVPNSSASGSSNVFAGG